MTAFGTMPWHPIVAMGDGTGGYDSARMTATELAVYDVLVSCPKDCVEISRKERMCSMAAKCNTPTIEKLFIQKRFVKG